jgi:hypothetical protein
VRNFGLDNDCTPKVSLKRVSSGKDKVSVRLALSDIHRETAFQIRYAAYRAKDYIGDMPGQRFSDRYDDHADTSTILAYKNDCAAATLRVSVHRFEEGCRAPSNIQAMEIFESDIIATMAAHRRQGRWPKVLELTKLARRPEYFRNMDIVFALYRAVGYLVLYHDADIIFNAVRRHHVPIYKRFGFRPLSQPRPYPDLNYETILMGCFRNDYSVSCRDLLFLQGLSTQDSVCAGLLAGELVAIRHTARTAPALQET